MFYRISADIIVILHLFWIIFLISGAFWGRRRRPIKFLHIGGMGFSVIMQTAGWYCPLTYVEIWLRQRYDPSRAYSGSFIINYVQKLIYTEISAAMILTATIFLAALSAWIYVRRPEKVDGP